MASKPLSLRFRRTIKAPPAEVYRAFTHPTALRDWLADWAEATAHTGGNLYLWWNSGYWAAGQYTALEPSGTIAFSWLGRADPAPTRVRVSLRPAQGGTALNLTHSGLGRGKAWSAAAGEIGRGWEAGLENLQSVLETGTDLRLARLPRMGIFIGDFSSALAEQLGVPVSQGLRLEGTAEGTGAREAGLQPNDVIVRLGGHPVVDMPSLARALVGRQAGDTLAMTYFRGGERHTARLTLSARPPAPPLPASAAELAAAAQSVYSRLIEQFSQHLAGVSEAEAERRPAPNEWNLKELVAHFIACERDFQAWIADMLNDNPTGDSLQFRPNVTPRLQAIVARYPSLEALLGELRQAADESVALLRALPEDFVARRPMFRRVAQWVQFVVPDHLPGEHAGQLAATLAAARAAR